jgi:hypothetical protein
MEARAFEAAALSSVIFNPNVTYPAAADAAIASAQAPGQEVASAGEAEDLPTTGSLDRNAAGVPPAGTPPAGPPLAGTPPAGKRVVPPPAHAAHRTGALLNDAQIASIRDRLKLTSDQQQYWPQVESALRAVTWRHHGGGNRPAAGEPRTIDPEAVEGLKSAAIPLILRLREDQKSEVRKLARLMGLESVASQL